MASRFRPFLAGLGGTVLLALCGCGGGDDDDNGEPTGNTCPPGGTTLTAQNFAQPFFQSYCTRCHSSTLSGPQRNGAPPDANFDTLEGIRAELEEINELAGADSAGVNTVMPPSDPKPTDDERRQLNEWIICGAP